MKGLIMIIVLSMFFITGNNAENGWAKDFYEPVPFEPVARERGEEGYAFGNGTLYLDLGLPFGYLKGDTTYRISFDGGESELAFPLEVYMLGVHVGWGYKNAQRQEKVRLDVKWLTNVSEGTGKMKDSDWIDDDASFLGIPGYDHPGKDIYSESDIKLRAHVVNISAIYNFWPIKNVSIGPMVGYRYQFFKYDVKNTSQIGYDLYDPFFTAYVRGRTLEYEVTYHIPYFGLNSNILLGKRFRTNLNFSYAPWAFAKDRDDHLLRYKLSEGDTDGYAYIANLNANWNFMAHLYLSIGGEYMKIHTTGTQHQSFYAGPYVGVTSDVDDKITSSQWLFYGMISYRF
jgi:outer membrane protease